jgi:hypothetical protein
MKALLMAAVVALPLLAGGCVYYPARPYRAHYAAVWVPAHWDGPRGDVWVGGHWR